MDDYRQFKEAIIAGWNDDEFGIWGEGKVLSASGMRKRGFAERVVKETEFGIQAQFQSPPQRFILGGGKNGHYQNTWARKDKLQKEEGDQENPIGGPLYEGPLGYRPWVCTPARVAEKCKADGADGYRVCADHKKTGVNAVSVPREVVLPSIDDFVELLGAGWRMRKLDAKTCFGHHHIPQGIAELWGTHRLVGGGFYRRREMDLETILGPAVCMEVAGEMRRILREMGVACNVFMDDWLVAASTETKLDFDTEALRVLAKDINYDFDPKKEEAGTKLVLLGLVLSILEQGWLCLPENKLSRYEQDVDDMLATTQVTMRRLAQVAGRLNYATECVVGGAARLRGFSDACGASSFFILTLTERRQE